MPEEFSDVLRLDVPCDPTAPRVVREALNGVEEIGSLRNDASLVASELVTNAVLHSGCEADHTIRVFARLSRNRLVISVHDPGISGRLPHLRFGGSLDLGGLGLRLVEQIARDWGAERSQGCHVWAELAVRSGARSS